jgi:hypothetical protein
MITLLSGASGNGSGTPVTVTVYPMILAVWADDFDSGAVTIEVTPDDGTTWIEIERNGVPLSYTANKVEQISGLIPRGLDIRATLTGAGTPVNVNAALYEVTA